VTKAPAEAGAFFLLAETPTGQEELHPAVWPRDTMVRELGESIKEIELSGNYFGLFSLTVVIYDLDPIKVERTCAEFYKVFSVHDGQLYEEKYNLLNAFLATVPGNYPFNLRYMYLLNTNYADFSFLFTLHEGERRNQHLREEYLAVLETNHRTPYFLNLHYRDVAHTMILGRTGAGKSFLLNFLITNLQKYNPHTFIFDLGGSFESLTKLFGGAYARVGLESQDFSINPFCLAPEDLIRFWLGHANKSITDIYSKVKDDVTFRREVAEQVGVGFEISDSEPGFAPNCTQTTPLSTFA
jgi:type IV secretory pathway VirB4 component